MSLFARGGRATDAAEIVERASHGLCPQQQQQQPRKKKKREGSECAAAVNESRVSARGFLLDGGGEAIGRRSAVGFDSLEREDDTEAAKDDA